MSEELDINSKEQESVEDHLDELALGRVPCCFTAYSPLIRLFVLFTASSFFFACTAVDDLVSAAVPTLREELNISATQISVLYSASPVTALLASLATSFLVNKMTIRTLTLLSCIAILMGNVIFTYFETYVGKLIGRAIFGLGEGPLEVLMTLICMRWFLENDPRWPSLELSFGFTAAAGMSGAALGLTGIPLLLEDLQPSMFAYSIVGFVPAVIVIVSIAYWVLDYWGERFLDSLQGEAEEEPPMLEIVKSLSKEYWILFFMCGSLWSIIYVIMVYLTDYLNEKWDYSNFDAGTYSSLVFFIGIPVSIIISWIVSKKGLVLSLLGLGGIIFALACLALGLTKAHPIFGILGLGISMGMFEPTVFTAIALVLPERGSDTAFTFTALIFQSVLFAAPFGFGVIHDLTTPPSYDYVFVICSSFGVLNVGLCMWLAYLSPDLQFGSLTVPSDEDENHHREPDQPAKAHNMMGRNQKMYELLLTAFFANVLASILWAANWGWNIWNGEHQFWFEYLIGTFIHPYMAYVYFFFCSVLLHSCWVNMFIYKTENRFILHAVLVADIVIICLLTALCITLGVSLKSSCDPENCDPDVLILTILMGIFCTLTQIFTACVVFWFKKPWCVPSIDEKKFVPLLDPISDNDDSVEEGRSDNPTSDVGLSENANKMEDFGRHRLTIN